MEQKMEPAMVPMPNHYKPSFSCGIYGSFVAHQTLQKMIKKDQKMREIKMMEEQKMQDFNREMERKKEQIRGHRTSAADFSIIRVPPNITNKPKRDQLVPIAAMYKKMLFDHMPRRKHLGGWILLATKNMKNNANQQMKSPKELGYSIIEPKCIGDPVYEQSVIRFLRDDVISISKCVGKSGSYFVAVTFDNNSDKSVTFTIPQGMVWEQDRFRKVQNLAVTGFYKNQPSDSQATLHLREDLEITIPANARNVTVNIECHCIDSNHSSPNGEGMNATPLRCDAAVNSTNQQETWNACNSMEGNDLFDP
eukprot:161173_1